MLRWDIEVIEYNTYGDKVVKRIPMSVLGNTKTDVTTKVRQAFEAKYDGFRKFWSHGWSLNSVTEEPAVSEPTGDEQR